MAVRRLTQLFAYGVGDSLIPMAPLPIIAKRDPGVNDLAELGTVWVNEVSGAVFMLSSISANSANWATSAVSGNVVALDVQITTGDLTIDAGAGGIDVGASAFTVSNSGNVVITGDLSVAGVFTFTGDLDLTSAALIDLTSTLNAAPSIYLHANGGVTEQILLRADQGTSVNSVALTSDVGGITLTAGLATADAINLVAAAGGIDIDSASLALDTSAAFSIDGAAASNVTVAGAGIDLTVSSAAGRVVVDGGEAAADAVRIVSSNAGGGVDIDAGTAGFAVDSTGAFSIDGVAASNVTTTGAGIDLTLSSVLGSVLVSSTEDAALAIRLHANGGVSETIQLHSDQGTGVGSINLLSDVGGITLTATGLASADAINLEASAGGVDVDAALQINVDSAQAAADAVRIIASDAAGGIDVDYGTGGMTVNGANGAFALETGTGSIDIGRDLVAHAIVVGNATGATSLTLASGTGDVIITSTDAITADAVGVLELNSSAGIIGIGNDADAFGINIGTGAAARPIVVGNTTAGTTVTLSAPAAVGVTLDNSIRIITGAGSPDTVITAPAGSIFLRTDPAGATSRMYINTDSATAWTNVTCAA